MNSSTVSDKALFAARFINHTGKNVFLTGKAGTGKTTFLRKIVDNTYKKCLIVAPTGIAAINAGGVTIHSMFQLPFGAFIPQPSNNVVFNEYVKFHDPAALIKNLQMFDFKRRLLREAELLIIDEVSMLRADLLDAIDCVLRHVRRKNNLPFGGMQVLFIGDLLQLPPVVKNEEWEVLRQFYAGVYFFNARVLQQHKPVYIELDKIYRQTDDRFVGLLNNLREGIITKDDTALLNTFYKPNFVPAPSEGYITLTTHNYKANEINKTYLQSLSSKTYYFDAKVENDFMEHQYPIERQLELKAGAQVMFVKNDITGAQRFFNGKIGVISSIDENQITVRFNDNSSSIRVEPYVWKNIKYKINTTTNEIEEVVAGTFTQYPIRLAWAITVHKSQGLTFEKAIIDVGSAFAPGQIYVALSRLKSLDGLVLTSPINQGGIAQDENVIDYSKSEITSQNLHEMLGAETYHFLKEHTIKCFDLTTLVKLFEEHTTGYSLEKQRSNKQQHYHWAKDIEQELKNIQVHTMAFQRQIANVMDKKEEGYIEYLKQRVVSATAYFLPLLKDLSSKILRHILIVKNEKKIKTYVEELLSLELAVFEQQKLMNKALAVTSSIVDNKEISKKELERLYNNNTRSELLMQVTAPVQPENETPKKTKKKKGKELPPEIKIKKEKIIKLDTKEETLSLLKQGHDAESIAQLRGLSVTTIEGHLAYFITRGELDAKRFVEEEKIKNIITVSKTLNTLQLNPIKQALGDEYTYSDIKMAIASYLSQAE